MRKTTCSKCPAPLNGRKGRYCKRCHTLHMREVRAAERAAKIAMANRVKELEAEVAKARQLIADYEDVIADTRRNVVALDRLINGSAAAEQASLADIIMQIRSQQAV